MTGNACIKVYHKSLPTYNGLPTAVLSGARAGAGALEINSSDIFLEFSKNNYLGNYFKHI